MSCIALPTPGHDTVFLLTPGRFGRVLPQAPLRTAVAASEQLDPGCLKRDMSISALYAPGRAMTVPKNVALPSSSAALVLMECDDVDNQSISLTSRPRLRCRSSNRNCHRHCVHLRQCLRHHTVTFTQNRSMKRASPIKHTREAQRTVLTAGGAESPHGEIIRRIVRHVHCVCSCPVAFACSKPNSRPPVNCCRSRHRDCWFKACRRLRHAGRVSVQWQAHIRH